MIRRILIALAAMAVAGCTNPKAQANMAQAINDAAAEMSALRNDIAQVQSDLDSLRTVVAKQDTIIGRLAAVNGVPR